jgi:outer membrane protein assembly factor BamA
VKALRFAYRHLSLAVVAVAVSLLVACSSVKHVPDGKYLLDKVSITVSDSSGVQPTELYNFLRQTPNHVVLGFAKLQLSTYSLSGSDSTKWYNRWLRKLGQPPVIYDEELTQASARQLSQALINRGYMDARVTIDSITQPERKRIQLNYIITPGKPHTISSISYNIADSAIRTMLMADSASFDIKPGSLFDRNILDEQRAQITKRLRDAGYYAFNREYINYTADTVAGSKNIDLTLNLRQPSTRIEDSDSTIIGTHSQYRFGRVRFILDADNYSDSKQADTVRYGNIEVVYCNDRYLRPSILEEKCFINAGAPYSASAVDRTYESLGQLGILKFINIEMKPINNPYDNTTTLDALIYLSRNKKQSTSVEVEGTNSEGDLGFGLGLTYQHRNLAKGSELLTAKVRGAYESLSGDLNDLINNRYTEFAGEVGITFPKFECPFLSKDFKQRRRASTEFAVSLNYQERPEYTRVIAGAAWKWKWTQRLRDYTQRHTYDLIDINYVRLPSSTINFIDEIAPTNPLLRYSYEDHFIMRMGYTFYRTNRRIPTATVNAFAIQPSVTTLRVSVESAGNLLYGISSLIGQKRQDGVYKILGTQYSQYLKGDIEYTYTRNFNSRNAMAWHVGFGLAYPYGNSSMVPFEKRFYAGGANGVRGWGVRTLGPGSYDSKTSVTDFINQCGDISLDLSMEYRAKLFWVFEGALFVDAGNIWTVHNYESQPGGQFKFNQFYKQIAAAYGCGLRMDFTYFLLRFDLGMKAHNPAMNQEPWPLIHPKWGRDANFHFSVGYPF